MKSGQFFSEIESQYNEQKKIILKDKGNKKYDKISIQITNYLPAKFMAGTQSIKKLEKYTKEYSLINNKKLTKSMNKYVITYHNHKQNHRITWKSYKYLQIVMNFLKFVDPQETKQLVSQILLA